MGTLPKTNKLTLENIAELAGVSRSTASRVLRNQGSVSKKARTKVMRVVEETGFQPNAAARSLTGHRTNIIGVFITEIAQAVLSDPYFSKLLEGVAEAANEYDQTLTLFLLHDTSDINQMTTRIIQNAFVDGIVVSSTAKDNPVIPRLQSANLPFVVLGRIDDANVNYVDADNVNGAFTAVSHLIRQGYQRIGTITGTMNNYSAIDRLEGYKNALRVRGRAVDPTLIAYGDFVMDSGYANAKKLLEQNVDAIFAASDSIALGAMRAIEDVGLRIPHDVAIIGFDDLQFAEKANPPLTTIRQPIRRMGKLAVEMLHDIVTNKPLQPSRVSVPTELIVRASTGG